ncbi:MAG: potassium channel family protein [Candidatus Woesearchaeota archaeon]
MKTEVFERITIPQIATYWLSGVIVFAAIYCATQTSALTTMERIGDSLYLSATTALTLGYTDIAPEGISKIFAILEALGSLSLFGLFIGKIVSKKQEQILEQVEELSVEEATHKAITELYLFRSQTSELLEDIGSKKRNPKKEFDSIQLILSDALQTFTQTKTKIDDPHKAMMHLSLMANSITHSLSRLVELLEEFNKRKIGWNKESTTATLDQTEQIKAIIAQNYERTKSDDAASKIVEEKLEDLNKIIADLQKLIKKS